MRLEIHTQMPQVKLDVALPKLKMNQQHPQVRIEQELPRVTIDQSAPLGEMGLKSSLGLARSGRDQAQAAGYQAIGDWAAEGDRYLEIHQGVDVADVVKERTTPPIPELNVAAVPRSRPKIEVSGGLRVDIAQGSVQTHTELGSVDLFLQDGTVTVSTKDVPRMGEAVDIRI